MIRYPFLDLGKVTAPMRDELAEAALRVIDSGRFIGGCEVDEFERTMAAMCGADYAIGVSNGLDALRLVLRAWVLMGRLAEGDGVIVPSNTYVASVLAVIDAGLRPVFVEPDEATMNLSGRSVMEALKSIDSDAAAVKAIMPVHLYGRVCWDSQLADIVRTHDWLVIEDVAQAIGAFASADGVSGGRHAGGIGHAGAFSFYPTKNVGALGDAGAVTTFDPELAHVVRCLANYGSDRRYHNIYAGFNCRLDSIQAAMLGVKLRHIDRENDARRLNAEVYMREIVHPEITLPLGVSEDNPRECVWHQFVVRCNRRDELQDYLRGKGVATDIHYAVPPHMQPALSGYGLAGKLPVAERMGEQVLSLPVSSATSRHDARDIAHIINEFPQRIS